MIECFEITFLGIHMKLIIILFFTISLSACSGVKMISPDRKLADKVDTSKLYKQSFLQKMNLIKDKFRTGKTDAALKDLGAMKEAELGAAERSTRKNLIGVINFSKKNWLFEILLKKKKNFLAIFLGFEIP